jgi:flagellar biosynthesis/type III secretory pathway M-ring protein FliF/YscJ
MDDKNVIEINSLPHPISMFLLGFFTLAIIVMWYEYKKAIKIVSENKLEMEKLKEKMENLVQSTDEKLMFVSKKIDSRVDKALGKK